MSSKTTIVGAHMVDVLQKIASVRGDYRHNAKYSWSIGEQNAHAYILSSLMNSGVSFLLENGKMHFGTWQSILFIEMDGSRSCGGSHADHR